MGKIKEALFGLVALVAGAASEGCFVQHAPYASMTVTSPRARHTEVYIATPAPVQVFVPQQPSVVYYPQPVGYQGGCVSYAASAAESMNPGGARVNVCGGSNPVPGLPPAMDPPRPRFPDVMFIH